MKRLESRIPRPAAPVRRTALAPALDLARSAAYLAAAWSRGAPGLGVHLQLLLLGAQLLLRRRIPRATAGGLMVAPLDSVRYFEVDFCLRAALGIPAGRYLDLSSPRALPLLLLRQNPALSGELLNPDERDLAETRALVAACGLQERCTLRAAPIAGAQIAPESCALVTALSVIEHIPAHREAVVALWRAVKPGGRLVVTVPCAREALEEYVDFDEYGLLARDARGFVFGQRFYDAALLRETFFEVCGAPAALEIFGERRPGTAREDRARKNSGLSRPWREPYAVATGYARFDGVDDLPGWGVAGLSFHKA